MIAKSLLSAAIALLALSAQSTAPPRRIVSLVPAVTEMLFAIGAGDAVVGVSMFDTHPPEVTSRAKVGGLVNPDFERILSLRPDLVVVYGTQNPITERFSRANIPIFTFQHSGLADITRTMKELGARTGHIEAANARTADIERQLAAIRARTAGRARPKTMMVFERAPDSLRGMFGSGGVGFIHDVLDVAGGTNVFADVSRESVQISTEQVIAKSPDVILEFRSGPEWTPARALRERDSWRVVGSVPAVRNGRVHILIDEKLTKPGPRMAEAALAIAKVLHPGAF